MNEADLDVFGQAMRKLVAAFRTEVTPELVAIYAEGLDELSIDSILGACSKALRRCSRFPTVAELLDLANDGTRSAAFLPHVQSRALPAHSQPRALPASTDTMSREELRDCMRDLLAKGIEAGALRKMPASKSAADDHAERNRQLHGLRKGKP